MLARLESTNSKCQITKYLPWPHPRPVITRRDDWLVYVAIGSRVVVPRAELERLFPETDKLHACVARLRDAGLIDCVTSIQRHRPTYERYELPLKD